LHRQRRREHAERAGHQHPRVRAHLRRRAEAAAVARQRRHQTGRHANPDQAARDDQRAEAARERKGAASEHRNGEKNQHHTLRAEAVERAAQRQLQQRKAEKVRTGEQPEVARRQRELRAEHGRERRRDGAQQC
jgi:hypothetical protein